MYSYGVGEAALDCANIVNIIVFQVFLCFSECSSAPTGLKTAGLQLFVSTYSEELELHLSCFTFCLTWLIWGLFQPAAVWPQCEHGRSGDVWTVHPHL